MDQEIKVKISDDKSMTYEMHELNVHASEEGEWNVQEIQLGEEPV